MSESERVGRALLRYRDDPPIHEDGMFVGRWYQMGEVLAIVMAPQTEFTTGELLTRLAHLMGVDSYDTDHIHLGDAHTSP